MNEEPDLHGWAESERRNVLDLADMLGVPPEAYRAEPANLVPALQDDQNRQLDPLQTVAQEFAHLPVGITRMLGGAEIGLGLVAPLLPWTHSPTGPTTTR
ncbi:hypothetical protein ACFV3N_09130 [Streptomyces bauhiniae]|uniref:hypothetical protein n=1 Tax=Streptomyces bauhiniae TaxID=2340725 RepID=UPI0036501507